ncbi:MAG TPA: hypothetical protein GX726_02750 [Clostridiales bacterium]|jgi:hypothetical protein|nr:hypothetical protein [Clostridiales bacterium]
MRTEASLDQIEKLYEVVGRIKDQAPWNRLGTMDLITIALPGHEPSPFYFNVVGKTGNVFGIYMYQGCDGLNDLYQLAEANDTGIPTEYLLGNQNFLAWYQGEQNEVPKQQMENIDRLGLKFSGENAWPYFLSYKKGYMPWIPDADEAQKLLEGLTQFELAYKAMKEKRMEIVFPGETLVRSYDEELDKWYNVVAPLDVCPHPVPALRLASRELIGQMKEREQREDEIWEIDLFYGGAPVYDEDYDRPINPKILALTDQNTGGLIEHDMLAPNDEQAQAIYGMLVDVIMNYHRPSAIHWRNPAVGGILNDLLMKTNIKSIHRKALPVVDSLIADFRRKLK